MPERRQNLARMNRARLHTLSPELTAARKKKILLSFHRNICFRRSAAREDLLAFPVPGLCMRSFAVCFAGRGGTTKGRYPPVAFRGITADEAAALPDAGGAWCVRVFPAKAARRDSQSAGGFLAVKKANAFLTGGLRLDCAHNLCAKGAQIPHLRGVEYVSGRRSRRIT